MSKKIEIDKAKCAKKFKNILGFIIWAMTIVIIFIPYVIPFIMLGIVSLGVNKNVSVERVLKWLWIFDCFEKFSKEYKDVIMSEKIKKKSSENLNFERKREILRKRKDLTRVLSNISSPNTEVKKTKEIVEDFEAENNDFFTDTEDEPEIKIKKESVIDSFSSQKKTKIVEEKKIIKEKKSTLFDDKKESLSSTSSSIWDNYDSVMDDFKK